MNPPKLLSVITLFSIFLNCDSLTLLFQYRVPCVLVWPSNNNMGTLDYIEMKHNIMQFNFLFLSELYFCSISKNLWKYEPPLISIQIRPFVWYYSVQACIVIFSWLTLMIIQSSAKKGTGCLKKKGDLFYDHYLHQI